MDGTYLGRLLAGGFEWHDVHLAVGGGDYALQLCGGRAPRCRDDGGDLGRLDELLHRLEAKAFASAGNKPRHVE